MTERQRIRLTYKDRDGKETRRIVRLQFMLGTTFVGYCELRGAPRTFNMTRVVEAVDLETGEILVRNVGH